MVKKFVYYFGPEGSEGNASMKNILGGKGANLAEMCSLGIPVPAGFTISADMCVVYYENDRNYPPELKKQVLENLKRVEETMGKKFGDKKNPLLLSVRSGARVSMPGMMDTVLNLGLNEQTLTGLIKTKDDERFAWDSYRRFMQMFGNVVLEVKGENFEHAIDGIKKKYSLKNDLEMTVDHLKELVAEYKKIVKKNTGKDFPTDPMEQLWAAIEAVFGSWMNPRACYYRKMEGFSDKWGTAVNVQAMVFGNMGNDCGTGVAFTRNPATGERLFFGEYLINAQGEDVVAGIRTPQQVTLTGSRRWAESNGVKEKDRKNNFPSLEEYMPEVYEQLVMIYTKLENHYKDMQDIEFTIENKKLWMLQTRNGKRTAFAAVKIAVEMVNEGMITKDQALLRVKPEQIDQLLHPQFIKAEKAKAKLLSKGLPASPGAATGQVVFNAEAAVAAKKLKKGTILVRIETSPEDIGGMDAANGILTARGGMTSHAAVVARGMGKCCVSGCGAVVIDYKAEKFTVGTTVVKEGDWISIDGSTGEVYLGKIGTEDVKFEGDFEKLMIWADERRVLKIRTNADTPKDAKVARNFGAEGIGLCRTEHMFFEGDRIKAIREMILADDLEGRQKALKKLIKHQRNDFYGILKEMQGLPVTIRLLDPPLHEFLPHEPKQIKEMADEMGISEKAVHAKVNELHEFNPMLGHRGCRLGITYPEISEMQARAIFEAACDLAKEGIKVLPEIMVPLVGKKEELAHQKKILIETAEKVFAEKKIKVEYMLGTMIEVPRGALTADEIAEEAEFFSFGTNDLTQMTFGFSRDDSGKFIKAYQEMKILSADPFQSIDQDGVGQLVEIACKRGRKTRPMIKLGVCGEHGGDPASIDFFHRVGLNYVSCSPYRVPIARLAAAQAAINNDLIREMKRTIEDAYGNIESAVKAVYKEMEKKFKKN
ncbi:MAG TPA: pyruvate, phosphate dikinase [bacterium]|nr:pyruvate, phosphate dikinase [bacterium]HPS31039.1 pyruvate, phosphate dikinase [bacterium]